MLPVLLRFCHPLTPPPCFWAASFAAVSCYLGVKREEAGAGDDALMAEMRSTYMPDKGEVSLETGPVL